MSETPWLTTAEAAAYLRQPSRAAFRMWARRRHLPLLRVGRKLLVHRNAMHAAMGIPGIFRKAV